MDKWKSNLLAHLEELRLSGATSTYQEIAHNVEVPGPARIHQLTNALEDLIREDAGANAPLRAAVAISRARDGLPGPGFFTLCQELGLYFGPVNGPQAAFFHDLQLKRLYESRHS